MATQPATRALEQLTGVTGVPETRLTPDLIDRLPDDVAPAPWETSGSALIWASRATPEVRAALPSSLRGWRSLLLIGAMVHYDQTPVGAYDEVVASVILLRGRHRVAHVPFIAVDSAASIVGGRVNWSLPKTMSGFDGRPANHTPMTAHGSGWSVTAIGAAGGPRLPYFSSSRLLQEGAAGLVSADVRMRASGRLAKVRVTVEGSALPRWLRSGTFPGFIADQARGTFLVASPPS